MGILSQCTYRCVVLPDPPDTDSSRCTTCLNAPTGAWCSLTSMDSWRGSRAACLNAPTGAWCSLTEDIWKTTFQKTSQCTYRCVVLPDLAVQVGEARAEEVSMHLQVRGAP